MTSGGGTVTVVERLEADMKAALKAREAGKTRLSVIRLARAALKNAEIEKRRPLTEAEVVEVLAREARQRKDAIEEYRRLGRHEAAAALEAELAILEEYLPRALSPEELRTVAEDAIAEAGVTDLRGLGKVMGLLMPRVRGRADGREVQAVVRELLERPS